MALTEVIPEQLPTAFGSHEVQLGCPCSLLCSVGARLRHGIL